jgi:bifunctional DNase/RNase
METLVEAEVWTVARTEQGNAVLVRPMRSERAVPIFVGQLETQSILLGFGGVVMPRPLTHDLVLSMLRSLGTEILRIEINELRDGTFYSRIILERTGEKIEIDARPSDAIALAVRIKCPIFIAENIVDEAGISIELVVDTSGAGPTETEKETRNLQEELEKAVAAEDYEKAALLRDQIKKRNTGSAEEFGHDPSIRA